jgi:predicted phage tail protein
MAEWFWNVKHDILNALIQFLAKRAYLYGIIAFDGAYTWEDFEELMTEEVKHLAATTTSFTTTDTKYVFSDLNPESQYAFRVRAVDAEDFESAWTEWVDVELTTAVPGIAMTAPAADTWYDLQGRRVSRPSAPGTYILRRGSITRKVIIK